MRAVALLITIFLIVAIASASSSDAAIKCLSSCTSTLCTGACRPYLQKAIEEQADSSIGFLKVLSLLRKAKQAQSAMRERMNSRSRRYEEAESDYSFEMKGNKFGWDDVKNIVKHGEKMREVVRSSEEAPEEYSFEMKGNKFGWNDLKNLIKEGEKMRDVIKKNEETEATEEQADSSIGFLKVLSLLRKAKQAQSAMRERMNSRSRRYEEAESDYSFEMKGNKFGWDDVKTLVKHGEKMREAIKGSEAQPEEDYSFEMKGKKFGWDDLKNLIKQGEKMRDVIKKNEEAESDNQKAKKFVKRAKAIKPAPIEVESDKTVTSCDTCKILVKAVKIYGQKILDDKTRASICQPFDEDLCDKIITNLVGNIKENTKPETACSALKLCKA